MMTTNTKMMTGNVCCFILSSKIKWIHSDAPVLNIRIIAVKVLIYSYQIYVISLLFLLTFVYSAMAVENNPNYEEPDEREVARRQNPNLQPRDQFKFPPFVLEMWI